MQFMHTLIIVVSCFLKSFFSFLKSENVELRESLLSSRSLDQTKQEASQNLHVYLS